MNDVEWIQLAQKETNSNMLSGFIKSRESEVRHPRCVSNKSNYKLYVYIVKHNYILGGMLFTTRKAQLHVSALNVGHLQVVQ